jgi:dihydrolipoamide dehydrogenase
MADELDLIVIGSGPGGYVAAIRAGQLGMKVAVVEKDGKYGGTCLHRGCIPTKALLHTADMLEQARKAETIGVRVAGVALDLPRAQQYKQKVVDKSAKGIEFLFRKNQVVGIHGRGRLAGADEVVVEEGAGAGTYRARHILLATGSVPRELAFAPTDGRQVIHSDHILELERVPASLVVLGAGAVGCEFASMFAAFGSQVTLVEMLPRVLPLEDEEVSAELARALRKRGVQVLTDTRLAEVARGDQGLVLRLTQGGGAGKEISLAAEVLLVAVGRAPVIEGLGLEQAGIELDRGYVRVNGTMQTSLPHVYAIGDIVPTPWLAHVASAEGILAVEHMAGLPARPIDYDRIPSCTYCDPEVGSVGLSEARARERGHPVAVGRFPFSALGKAAILGKTEGFVKVVRETRYDQLLGIHVIGPHATDLIGEACVALQVESTTEELFRTIHAHPTLSEAMAEAAHAAAGHALHV